METTVMESTKYPRTPHLGWSPGGTRDDRTISGTDLAELCIRPLVITEKLDGSNTALCKDGPRARSHSGAPTHPTFSALWHTWTQIAAAVDLSAMTIFGEWTYAVHSIDYPALHAGPWFHVFAIRDRNGWAAWPAVETWAVEHGLVTVPALWKGTVGSVNELRDLTETLAWQPSVYGPIREGVVVRNLDAYPNRVFGQNTAKWVREDHIQTDEHWSHQPVRRHGTSQP